MKSERGMAVIMALLLVALAASAASLVLWQQSLWWQQVEADRQRAQMHLLLDAQVAWAQWRLRPVSPTIAYDQPWARPWVGQEGDYRWQARLTDLQSRLNLNALALQPGLVNKDLLDSYRRLLAALQLSDGLADNLVEWCGLRDAAATAVPSRPVRLVRDWRELGQVPGYEPAVLRLLAPYVTLLPSELNLVNVNTASPLLLAAMVPNAAPAAVAHVVQERGRLPFRDAADFIGRLGMAGQEPPKTLGAGSSAFLLQGTVRHHAAEQRIDAIFRVESGRVRLLARPDVGALPAYP